jgi:hypothetical protein
MSDKHRWKFYRAGGVDQVMLRDGADLAHLGELDPKLWVALAMPTRGVEFDPKTLEAIDTDKDGRIRLPEVVEAVRWTVAALQRPDDLLKGSDTIALDAIKDPALQAGARRILENLGRGSATSISLADVADTAKIFAETKFNGDGVVPADSCDDAATRQVIEDIVATHGPVPDRSGKPGVDRERMDKFFREVEALTAWDKGADQSAQPLGAATSAAADATRAVRAKVDDYFGRCQLAAVDARAAQVLAGTDADLASLAMKDLGASLDEVARLPLARVEAGRALPLKNGGLNPAWSTAAGVFAELAVGPLLGNGATLTFEGWNTVKTRLQPYEAWQTQKPATQVEKLGLERVRAIGASGAKAAIEGLLARDLQLEAESRQVEAVSRLLQLHRDLWRLLNNFVNFSDFYARRGAVFQAGTLFLDGRGCSLCLEVLDASRHGSLASLSGAYLAYCELTRPGGEKRSIVAAFTDGDSDNLLVGRNGIFFDRKGNDWDATITKIVANPISIREAFWAPYKKLVRLIEEQVGKRAAAADAEANQRIKKTAETVAEADKAGAQAASDSRQPERTKIDVGTVAAIGVAIGGIGAMVAGVLTAFFGLGPWMPLGVLALLALISGPSVLLAYLKLRQRNLGPLLDANGWAINGRARINVPFGGALTDVAALPAGAERSLKDPYAEKRRPWRSYVFLLLLASLGVAWYVGRLDRLLPEVARSTRVLGEYAPGFHK